MVCSALFLIYSWSGIVRVGVSKCMCSFLFFCVSRAWTWMCSCLGWSWWCVGCMTVGVPVGCCACVGVLLGSSVVGCCSPYPAFCIRGVYCVGMCTVSSVRTLSRLLTCHAFIINLCRLVDDVPRTRVPTKPNLWPDCRQWHAMADCHISKPDCSIMFI